MRKKDRARFAVSPYPRSRLLMTDGGSLGLKKHMVHGLIEMDVSDARKAIRRYRREKGTELSFTAFFLSCLGKSIDEDRQINSYRGRNNKVYTFDDVDANLLFEVKTDEGMAILPRVLRGINLKSPMDLQREMLSFRENYENSAESKFIDLFVRFPKLIRRAILKRLMMNPLWVKENFGTVLVSSLGIFGSGSGWGIPVPNHNLQLTLGGVFEKPCLKDGRLENRNFLSITVSFDHDIIDGLPVARFINRLRKRVEIGPYYFE